VCYCQGGFHGLLLFIFLVRVVIVEHIHIDYETTREMLPAVMRMPYGTEQQEGHEFTQIVYGRSFLRRCLCTLIKVGAKTTDRQNEMPRIWIQECNYVGGISSPR
jgi:hypothetical protein